MAVAITATEQDAYPPRVLVSVTGLTLGDNVELYRSVGGQETLLRGGSADNVTDTSFLVTDAELPFGVPVRYLAFVNGADRYYTSDATHTLVGGKVAVTDAVTGASAETVIMAWDEKRFSPRSSVFRVGGRNVVVSGDVGMFEGDIEFYVEATSSRDNLMRTLTGATEGVVQIRQPGGYDGVDCYVSVVGINERRFSQDGSDQRRLIVVNGVETEAWSSDLQARGVTYAELEAAYTVSTSTLNANPYFETDASNWTAGPGSTISRVTTQFHEGVASLQIVPDGIAANSYAQSEEVGVIVGAIYRASAWLRTNVARTVNININWYDASHVYISTSSAVVTALSAGTWTQVTKDYTAPVNAAYARLVPTMGSTPPATDRLYVDQATISRAPLTYADLAGDYATYLDLAQAEF